MEADRAHAVGGHRRHDGIEQGAVFLRAEGKRFGDLRVYLVEHADVGDGAVAVVADRDGKRGALGGRLAHFRSDGQIDDDRLHRQHLRGARLHFPMPCDVFDARLKGHIRRAHAIGDVDRDGVARGELILRKLDRLRALLRIVKLQPGHVERGVVADGIGDLEFLVCAHVRIVARGGNGKLRDHKPVDPERCGRFARMLQKLRVAGHFVDDGLVFLPFEQVGDLDPELILGDRNVKEIEFLCAAGNDRDLLGQDPGIVLIAAGQLGVGKRIVGSAVVADRKLEIGDRARAFELRHRIAGDRKRDRMIAVGRAGRRQRKPCEKQRGGQDQDQNTLHQMPPNRFIPCRFRRSREIRNSLRRSLRR